MSQSVSYGCGCRFTQEGPAIEVKPCSRHRQIEVVQRALTALEQKKSELVQALAKAHEDLPPLQIEQEERQASGGERWR